MVMSPLYKKIAVCKFCTSNWLFCPALSDGLYLVSIGFNTHRTLLGTNKMTFPTFSATLGCSYPDQNSHTVADIHKRFFTLLQIGNC